MKNNRNFFKPSWVCGIALSRLSGCRLQDCLASGLQGCSSIVIAVVVVVRCSLDYCCYSLVDFVLMLVFVLLLQVVVVIVETLARVV